MNKKHKQVNLRLKSEIIIENNKSVFLIYKSKIIIIEGIKNFVAKLQAKDKELINTLGKYKIYEHYNHPFIFLNKTIYSSLFENLKINNLFNLTNELLMVYFLSKKAIGGRIKKYILASFSKKNPEYNYIIKILSKKQNAIYFARNLIDKTPKRINDTASVKHGGKVNINSLFTNFSSSKYKAKLAIPKNLVSDYGIVVRCNKMKRIKK